MMCEIQMEGRKETAATAEIGESLRCAGLDVITRKNINRKSNVNCRRPVYQLLYQLVD